MVKVAVCDSDKKQLEQLSEYMNKYNEEQGAKIEMELFQSVEELIEIYQYERAPFDVVLLDVYYGLEKINGVDIAEVIKKRDKDVLILFFANFEDYLFDEVRKELQIKEEEALIIETSIRKVKVLLMESLYFESNGRKIKIVTANDEVEFYGALLHYDEWLSNKGFFRVHRSYLVNLLYVKEAHSNNIRLTTGEIIYFSKRKRREIEEEFLKFHNN